MLHGSARRHALSAADHLTEAIHSTGSDRHVTLGLLAVAKNDLGVAMSKLKKEHDEAVDTEYEQTTLFAVDAPTDAPVPE